MSHSTGMKFSYFIYESTLHDQDLERLSRAYIYGGRGIGKSTFLARLYDRVSEYYSDSKNILLKSRSFFHTCHMLCEAASTESEIRFLLIDDLERFFQDVALSDESISNKALSAFSRLLGDANNRIKCRIIVTSSVPPTKLEQQLRNLADESPPKSKLFRELLNHHFSALGNIWTPILLTPWTTRWKAAYRENIENALVKLPESPIQSVNREIFYTLINDLTGGHPALLTPAVEELGRIFSGNFFSENEKTTLSMNDIYSSEVKKQVQLHLEDVLTAKGLEAVRKTIRSLRDSKNLAEQDAFKSLVIFVDQGELPRATAREILMENCLFYRDFDNSSYVVPGVLLRDEIKRIGQALPKESIIYLEQVDHLHGNLIQQRGSKVAKSHNFSGVSWAILHELFRRNGDPISFDEIRALLEYNESQDNALRSAIQRLDTKLRNLGFTGLMENVRGVGYRLNPEKLNN